MRFSSFTARRVAGGLAAAVLLVAVPAFVVAARDTKNVTPQLTALLNAPGPEEEASLASAEGYWHQRYAYPTGRVDQRWLLQALKQDRRVPDGIPLGSKPSAGVNERATSDKTGSTRAPALATNAFTSLGPQPQESTGCQAPCFTFGLVSGRVSAIAFDHTTTTPGSIIAYIGVDGGGVWKSTNCCTAATTWTVTTDGPLISTTSVDDVVVDPSNANVVYAATGDISFGSFAFGSSGILKSVDKGATWSVVGESIFTPPYLYPGYGTYPQYQAVSKVRVDPNDSNKVIAGTKTGLYFSYNAGTTWTGPCYTNSFTTQRQDITDLIVVDRGSDTGLFAAVGARGYGTTVQQNLGKNGANGIYTTILPSSGCPASWVALTNGWPAGTASGIPCDPPISNDPLDPCGATTNKLGRIEMALAPSTANDADPAVVTLYAEVQAVDPQTPCGVLQAPPVLVGKSRGCFLGLFKSTDSGLTWIQTANHDKMDKFTTPTAGPCGEDTPQNWYNQGLAVDPNNPNALYMDAIDIWKSTDGGVTLTDVSCGYYVGVNPLSAPVHVDNHVLAYAPGSSTNLLAGSDGGIYVSLNAANVPVATPTTIANPPTFTDVNKTMSTIEFYSGDVSGNFAFEDNPFIVAGAQDNGSSFYQFPTSPPSCPTSTPSTPGCTWSQRIGGDGMFARIEPKQGQRVFMESQDGNLQRSTNGPAGPYLGVDQPWKTNNDVRSFVFPYEIDKQNCPSATCDHMIAGSYRVWESLDGGTTWLANSPNLTKNTLGDRSFINQLAYGYLSNATAVVGTNDGNVQFGFELGQMPGTPATWVNVTGGNAILPNRPINDVVISPANSRIAFAAVGGFDQNTSGTPGHVFQVTCNPLCLSFTWANKTGNLPNVPVNAIAANPNIPKQVYVGNDWGVYFTDDINAAVPVWNKLQTGLPNTMVWDFAIDRGNTTLAVFTRSRGAFAAALPTLSSIGTRLFFDDRDANKVEPWTKSHEAVDGAVPCNTDEWHETAAQSHSPTHSWTNNPYTAAGGQGNCINHLTSPPITIPANAVGITLVFWERHYSEGGAGCNPPSGSPPCDYGIAEVTNDDGATWTTVSPRFEGGSPADPWKQITLPLGPQHGKTIKLRFTFSSDALAGAPPDGPFEGWFVDDVEVRADVTGTPTAVRLASFRGRSTARGAALTWRTASESDLLGFRVFRVKNGKAAKVNRTLVAAKVAARTRGARYTLLDRAVRPGTYTYRLQAVTASGKHVWLGATRVQVRRLGR